MGPREGRSESVGSAQGSSPFFAALVNAASSHVLEQDDLHAPSVLHLGAVVFPAALAVAQDLGSSGAEFLNAVVVGYEVGARVGRFLGPSHYEVFHTTGTAGTLAAAAAASRLMGADSEVMLHALGSAGTQAAGLWEFLRDAADSKQLHAAKAAANGVLAAWTAQHGLTGARRVLEGQQGMGAGMSHAVDQEALDEGLGKRWAILETSLKLHACCRHTHPSADALAAAMLEHRLGPSDIRLVRARVHQAALDVLGPVRDPQTPHQARFSMGFVLALIAIQGRAGVEDFKLRLHDPEVRRFMEKVEMVYDPEVDAAYPERWQGSIEIETVGGQRIEAHLDHPRGDPLNPLSRAEIVEKVERLVQLGGGMAAAVAPLVDRVLSLESAPEVGTILGPLFWEGATNLDPREPEE
jgi:2-methylcitrate dehydratase PrpD